jgi:murein DD-endopeptidase MepM/ murein hydrolase activator NlpD
MTMSADLCSGRAGGLLLRACSALVVLVSLAAPITASAQRGPDVVSVKGEAQRKLLPQARSNGSPTTSQIRFAWPAAGRIIFAFCRHPYGEGNDEINIVVAPGTEVRAVEAGRIAYTGDGIRGFHNLILMSHRDGWVSAYANASKLLVKRGDAVARGQVIARFGKGDPLHFELRHNSISVDPLLYLGDAAPAPEVVAQMTSGQCRG